MMNAKFDRLEGDLKELGSRIEDKFDMMHEKFDAVHSKVDRLVYCVLGSFVLQGGFDFYVAQKKQ